MIEQIKTDRISFYPPSANHVSLVKAQNVVEEAYCSTVLCLLGNRAMDEQRHILFPDEYKIPYMKF